MAVKLSSALLNVFTAFLGELPFSGRWTFIDTGDAIYLALVLYR